MTPTLDILDVNAFSTSMETYQSGNAL